MKTFLILLASIALALLFYKFYFSSFPTDYNKDAIFVDVRSPDEFAGGSVPGAINIPLDAIESNLSQFENQEQIVVFCRSGNRSGQAKSILEKKGFENVVNGGPWHTVAKNLSEK